MEFPDDDRRDLDQRRFKLGTTIDVAHIIATLGLIASLFTWGSDIKNKQGQHDVEIANLKANAAATTQEVRESLRELNAKMDRLIERGNK